MKPCFSLNRFLILFLLALAFTACEQVSILPDNTRTGYDYYQLSPGQYRIYDVYRISYNFVGENDTSRFELKQLVEGVYLNQEGDSSYVIHNFHRQNEEELWKLDSVQHIRLNFRQLIQQSNNKSIVKLVFPVGEGTTWNSNLLNTAPADSFRMVNVHQPFQLLDSVYERTLTVVHQNVQDTIVRMDVQQEVFALQTGPIYRIRKVLNYCATTDCIGHGIITTGIFEEMKLTAFGKE